MTAENSGVEFTCASSYMKGIDKDKFESAETWREQRNVLFGAVY